MYTPSKNVEKFSNNKYKRVADIHPYSWQHYLFDNFEIKFIAVCSLKEGVGPEVSKQLLSNVLENLQKWPEVDRLF